MRDGNDVQVVYNFLSSRSPFSESTCVRNIFSGLASETLETNNFYDLGSNLVSKMVDKDVFSLKFKRNNMVKTLANTKYVKDKESGVSIDPALLFQRLLVMVTNSSDIDLEEIMSFELCSFPPSLFDEREMLLKVDKPPLAKTIVGFVRKEKYKSFLGGEIFEHVEGKEEEEVSDILVNSIDKPIDIIEDAGASKYQFVLDGGSLLHSISWSRTSTYDDIAKFLASFVHKTYEADVVVFDGYENGASIKETHT